MAKPIGFKRAMGLMQIKGTRLVKTFTPASPRGFLFHVIPSMPGAKAAQVEEDVAEKIMKHPQVTDMHDGLFLGRSQTWGIGAALSPEPHADVSAPPFQLPADA